MKEKDCILVVDDDEGTRKSLVLLLKRKGFEIEYAGTGKEALAIAQGRPIDLTLLDIKLPDIEGVELLAPLKKTNPDMSIIMITGFASVESAVQSLTAGASGYITKPIDLDEMLARIKNALDHQHLVSEVRRAEEKIESLAKFPEENPNPVIRVANDGVLIFANKSAEFILNQLRLSVGTKVPEFLEKILKEAIESGSRLELEKIVNGKTYLFTIAPIIGQNYVNLYGLDITKRKKAEEELKINLTKYKVLFESFPLAITISDKMGNIIESNVRAEEILGLSPEEQSKRKIDGTEWQLIRSDGTPLPADEYASVRALKEDRLVQNVEMGVVKGNSAVTWISVTAAPIPLKDYGVAIAYSDITELKLAEQKLIENELKFRELFDNMSSGVAIYEADEDGNDFFFKSLNRAGERIDNFKRQDVIGKSILEIFPAVKEFGLFDILQRVWQTGVAESHPASLYKDARITGWRENFVYKLPSGEIAAIYDDITERKKAEVTLRESETYLKTIFNSAQIGLLIIDPLTHSIYDINPAAVELGGRTKNELIGATCHQFVCPADKGKCPITDLGQKIDNSERVLLRPDGKQVPILKTVVPIVIQGRNYLLESFIDITERKQAEEQLKHFNEELELAVNERTDQLNKSLHEKEILLKEIHHRVKNNLQIVISLLNLQSRYIKDETILNAIKESQNRIRAMALVHEKLYKSEDISHIDLSDYIRFLATSLFSFHNISPQKIRLTIDMKEVRIDINSAIPIGLIINELVSNSLKYAFPQGKKGEIAITGHKDADIIIIQIKDTGIGMPEGLDWKNAESLGLRLVISLVEQLQGTIELEKGAGTLFKLTLHEKTKAE
jgi:PAS domain S-box-containing protein